MDTTVMIVLGLLITLMLTIVAILVNAMRKISNSLNSIAYILKNNGVNFEIREDIVKVAKEVARNKDKIKKIEVSEEILRNKIENLSKEVSHADPFYRNKKIH